MVWVLFSVFSIFCHLVTLISKLQHSHKSIQNPVESVASQSHTCDSVRDSKPIQSAAQKKIYVQFSQHKYAHAVVRTNVKRIVRLRSYLFIYLFIFSGAPPAGRRPVERSPIAKEIW